MKNTYPSPLPSYEDVVADKDLFMSTLMKFHSEMGTNFWIPKVRFVDMDLHKLFVSVTSRGGIEKIVKEEKWKDVFDTFNFPKSQRNPIFRKQVLADYYSLLHKYEMVYFFKARGQIPPLTGSVNGKLKSGYHVTFKIGSWKLEGVMYESTEERVTQDPEKQSYDVSPKNLTHKANPQELFETRNIQLNKANNQKEKQWSPKQKTEANAPMQESEEQEGYSSGYNSEEREGYSSGYHYEEQEGYSSGYHYEEQKTEANAPMQESEEQEGYSSGYNSEERQGCSSGYNYEEQEGYSSGYHYEEQKTEANAPMQESEEQEGYSSGYNSEEREGCSSGYNSDEAAAHMEKAGDLRHTSLVDDPLTGVLDEIFDKAYSVTVTIDSEMLRGALFRFPSLGEDKKSGLRRKGSSGGQRAM